MILNLINTDHMQSQYTFPEEFEENFRVPYLLAHFILEDLTIEEEDELEKWIQDSDRNMEIFEMITEDYVVQAFMEWYFRQDHDKYLEQTKKRLDFSKPLKLRRFFQYAAAACIAGLIIWGIYAIYIFTKNLPPMEMNGGSADMLPGTAAATLTLANGRQIALDEARDTLINEQVRISNGVVITIAGDDQAGFNELSVPRKGFYKLRLPDGTLVWINAASSIRYPATFSNGERRVAITGEVYFEVAKDPSRPFIVSTTGADITALGTAFNVNAYPDEAVFRTTLVEGKIQVSKNTRKEILEAGQQLSITNGNWKNTAVDTSPFVAWTRNQFKMKNNTIEEVMRMIERWYDAKIIYKDRINDHFTGTIDRNVPVSRLLKLLEATGQVHFTIEGQTITVSR
jgi:ferric-dicitrate binding protein FerR (iron transport regulator)